MGVRGIDEYDRFYGMRIPPKPTLHKRDKRLSEGLSSFGKEMRAKLLEKSLQGYGGWETCTPERLEKMLREHLKKGDMVDVANFALMLWALSNKGAKELKR